MRYSLAILMLLATLLAADAGEIVVSVRSARPFGYFVGDLIYAHVDVSAPAGKELSAASLPRPGPLSTSLDLKDIAVEETKEGDRRLWRIDLVYQNFYVALDARNIEIPGFDLRIGDEAVSVSAWTVGVAPLREISPAQQELAVDYLRPDGVASLVDEARPKALALALASLAILSMVAVARDRGWPPFHRRPARVFNALARDLARQAHVSRDAAAFNLALRSVHRAIDAANGASLLAEDLPSFLARRPEFAPLRSSFDRFFAISSSRFFGDRAEADAEDDFSELLRFAQALSRAERRQ
jgi:mxaA protein